jgi:hypothetical protein
MYVVAREKIAALKKSSESTVWTDADVEKLLKAYLTEKPVPVVEEDVKEVQPERKVYVVGGDFFSQAEYDKVRRADDNVFSRYAAKEQTPVAAPQVRADKEICFYTETLAQIYAEQGYYDQSKEIYSKLILAYPEKSAYFAALIQKIEQINS